MFARRARKLKDSLLSVLVRVSEIRGLMLADQDGLALVSTVDSRSLEEALAAFAAAVLPTLGRAQGDFEMGPLYMTHIAGRDRQIFMTPVSDEVVLLAIVDSGATASTVGVHLLSLAREILDMVARGQEEEEERVAESA